MDRPLRDNELTPMRMIHWSGELRENVLSVSRYRRTISQSWRLSGRGRIEGRGETLENLRHRSCNAPGRRFEGGVTEMASGKREKPALGAGFEWVDWSGVSDDRHRRREAAKA